MAKSIDRFSYRVTWSEEDQECVGLCAEFPSLSWLMDNSEEALSGIQNAVHECIKDLQEQNEEVPPPLV